MSAAPARKDRSLEQRIVEIKQEQNRTFIQSLKPTTVESSAGFSSMGASSGDAGAPSQPTGNFLKTKGDTMIGPIAFKQNVLVISSDVIDISDTSGFFLGHLIIGPQTGTTDNLKTIFGAAFQGQRLTLQGIVGMTITINALDNIIPPNGTSFDLIGDRIVGLVFDSVTNKWKFDQSALWKNLNDLITASGGPSTWSNFPAISTVDIDEFAIQDADSISFKETSFDSLTRAIFVNTGVLEYIVSSTLKHRFTVGASTIFDLGSAEIDAFKPLDMNSQLIKNAASLEFAVSYGTAQKIDNSSDGKVLNFLTNGNARVNMSENSVGNGTLELFGTGGTIGQADASFKTVSTRTAAAGFRIGDFVFDAKNSSGVQTTYADIICESEIVTAGNERGHIDFVVKEGGSLGILMTLYGANIILPGVGRFESFMTHSFYEVVNLYGGVRGTVTLVNAPGPYNVTKNDVTIIGTNTASAVTINLPSVSTNPGQIFIFKKRSAGGSSVITRAGADTIDGAATYTLSAAGQFVILQSDGESRWIVISS